MFDPHYQPDPRLPGMGLGFFRDDASGHRVVGHEGRLPGFHSQLMAAPDDGIGVFAFTNGSSRAMFWLPTELGRLLRSLVGVSEEESAQTFRNIPRSGTTSAVCTARR